MNTRRVRWLFLLSLIVFTPVVSAQITVTGANVRFGNFSAASPVSVITDDAVRYTGVPRDILTPYLNLPGGEHTVSFQPDGGPVSSPTTLSVADGEVMTVIWSGIDQGITVINETAQDESVTDVAFSKVLAIQNILTPPGTTFSFRDVADGEAAPFNEAPRLTTQPVFDEAEYLAAFGDDWRTIEYGRSTLDSPGVEYSFPLHVLPHTDVTFNADVPTFVNYATDLSVMEWLTTLNQTVGAPFTFNNFLSVAETGGFSGALVQCENYMWFVWTDVAFNLLPLETQTYVQSAAGAGTVLNNSVLELPSTTPWLNSPTVTRGGTLLRFELPLRASTAVDVLTPTPFPGVALNIALTLTTRGNGVRNVIHVVDNVPASPNERLYGISLNYRDAINIPPVGAVDQSP
jgi:hypothetical protein